MSVLYEINQWMAIVIIFGLLCLGYQFGFVFGGKKRKIKETHHNDLVLAELTGLLGFVGILLAFTFSMSSERYEDRKQLVIQESLDIGTAYYRIGLLQDSVRRNEIRSLISDYLDSRIRLYRFDNTFEQMERDVELSENLQKFIWLLTAEVGREAPTTSTSLIIQSLNSMIDITGSIYGSFHNHVPGIIILILIAVCLLTIFTLGYSHGFSKDKNWGFAIGINLIVCAILLLIIDMDRPTSGILQVDIKNLTDLKEQMERYEQRVMSAGGMK